MCGWDHLWLVDAVMQPLLERYKGCEVRVYLARQVGRGRRRENRCEGGFAWLLESGSIALIAH